MSVITKEKLVKGKEILKDRVFQSPLKASAELSSRFKEYPENIHTVKRRMTGYAIISSSWDEFIDSKIYKKR
jgi:hypothetical protein